MPHTKAVRPSPVNRHIDLIVVRRLLATGMSQRAVGRVLGCSGPNIAQRLRRERDPVAERARQRPYWKKTAAEPRAPQAQAATSHRTPKTAGHDVV